MVLYKYFVCYHRGNLLGVNRTFLSFKRFYMELNTTELLTLVIQYVSTQKDSSMIMQFTFAVV